MSSRPTTSRPWTGQSQSRLTTAMSRPCSAQSRLTTARPQTPAYPKFESSCIVAVIEGRGVSHEVGMAALDKDTGQVSIVQLADSQSYVKTLHQIQIHSPSLVLVPDTSFSREDLAGSAPTNRKGSSPSLLLQYMREDFPSTDFAPVARRYWNDQNGMELIAQLCVEDEERPSTLLTTSTKYYALSAVCALLKHAELKLNVRYAAGSLRIRYTPIEGAMMIDPDTARNLELVGNISTRKSSHSLFGCLNYTYTAMASRLLRVNLLSPSTVQADIDARLDVVEELVQSEDRFTDVRDALKTLNKMDFDKLISALAASEARVTNSAKPASARVAQMLDLRTLVRNLPLLRKALEGSRAPLLRVIGNLISDARLAKIEQRVSATLNEDSAPAKGGIGAVNARVYAVKANLNRLLDVARETYKENVADIFQLNRSLSEQHELPINIQYQESGFVFILKKNELHGELPKGFNNITIQKGKWVFSSLELKKMNARMKDALDETLLLSENIIHELVAEIIGDIGALYKASEAVARVDMLWSFAHASIMRNYVRPEFTGTLAIKSGRHPILEIVQSAGTLVPNDVYCDDSSAFQIVQGSNMSGKSTYLRQIGLLSVMAMCGCFVPAEYASFRINDALLSRLSNDDDVEKSLSTFASEMTASAMIIGLATPKSLVLIDELGRGTSTKEGLGISHSIAEELIRLKPFVFFATHFKELSTTLSRQPTIVNLHLSVQRGRKSASNFGLTFKYKIANGAPEDLDHYGLELAILADLPIDVLQESKRVATTLSELDARQEEASKSTKDATRRKALLRLRTHLNQALDHSALPEEDLLSYIERFQKEIYRTFRDTT